MYFNNPHNFFMWPILHQYLFQQPFSEILIKPIHSGSSKYILSLFLCILKSVVFCNINLYVNHLRYRKEMQYFFFAKNSETDVLVTTRIKQQS